MAAGVTRLSATRTARRAPIGHACAIAALAGLCLIAGVDARAQSIPELTAPVNDFAGVIDAQSEAALDALIRQLQNATGDVVIVATIKTFQPEPDIASYAVKMFENGGRGIGQKGKDNGLLLLLAVDDRTVRAEIGYDLEGFITDGFSGEVSRTVMVPFFRKNDYGGGLLAGARALIGRIAEGRGVTLEGVPVRARRDRDDDEGIPIGLIVFLLFIGINMLQAIVGRLTGKGRRRRRWGSYVGPFGTGYGGGSWGGGSWGGGGGGGFGGGFGGFGGGRSGGGGGGASW
jgi:uncharacterized protein